MPNYKTKFTIANPHATGIFTHQITKPFKNNQKIDENGSYMTAAVFSRITKDNI
jgi:hypothetical protein